MIYYEDGEIKIRDIYDEDVISLFTWSIDSEVNRFDPRPMPRNSTELMEECSNYCKKFNSQIINEDMSNRKYKYFIITTHDDKPIGFVNFFSIDRKKKQGEMGVIIGDKRYWNKGIGSKGVEVATNYILGNMDIDRIYIETAENNIPAIKLFEKLSFKKCGEYLEGDSFKFIVMEKNKY